jgi:glycosidase
MVWEIERQNRPLFEFIRRLIAIRKEHPALRYGETETLFAADGAYAYRQHFVSDEAIVVLNPRGGVHHASLPTHSQAHTWMGSIQDDIWTAQEGWLSIPYLPALTAKILLPGR